MQNFVAIDFETANRCASSVCAVGIVVVKNGAIIDTFYSLIRPYPHYYADVCLAVHGLPPHEMDAAPQFPEVWVKAEQKIHAYYSYIRDGEVPLVAHNSPFDEHCLRAAHAAYGIYYPAYEFKDTLRRSRKIWPQGRHNLEVIAAYCGYDLCNHHHALADAEACAVIAMQIL